MAMFSSKLAESTSMNDIVEISNRSLDQLFENIESIESKMFNCLKYQYYRYYVKLSNNVRIWTVSNVKPNTITDVYTNNKIPSKIDETKEPILLLHGFMASVGFWILNLDSLAESNHPVYAIDLPGYSRSSRIHLGSSHTECEEIYVAVIQEFLTHMNINKVTLIGHSMGGFLASAYALQNTNQVKNLLLVDPWGYEDIKELIVKNLSHGEWLTIIKELFNWRHYFRFFGLALSPYSYFSFFRIFGEAFTVKFLKWAYPSMQKCYRIITNDTRDEHIIYKYIHHCTSCEYNNGELFMPLMCVCLGWSLKPMLPRILSLEKINEKLNETQMTLENSSNNMKILFVYGENSWIMKYPSYFIKEQRSDLDVKIKIIKNTGHQVVFEDPDEFLAAIEEYL